MDPVVLNSFQKKSEVAICALYLLLMSRAECREYSMRLFHRVVLTDHPIWTVLTGPFMAATLRTGRWRRQRRR